jgi:IS66 C-terminal element
LSRKNALFASGNDGGRRWADLASLIETCKLNGVNPQVYLTQGNRMKVGLAAGGIPRRVEG